MDEAVDRLEVKIIQASGLKGTESGPPSAYAEVIAGYNSYRTKHIADTNDPVWKANAMSFNNLLSDDIDTILIYVKHKDVFSGKDQVLGYVSIDMSTYYGSPKIEIDAWYDLLRANGDTSNSTLGKVSSLG
jgi:Ca2+-dependent lipid-binding protein